MDNMVFILLALGATSLPGLGIVVMFLAELSRHSGIRRSNSEFRTQLAEHALRDRSKCHAVNCSLPTFFTCQLWSDTNAACQYPPTICIHHSVDLPFQILEHHGVINPAAFVDDNPEVLAMFSGYIWGALVFQFLALVYVLILVKRGCSAQVNNITAEKTAEILGSTGAVVGRAGAGLMEKIGKNMFRGGQKGVVRGEGGKEKEEVEEDDGEGEVAKEEEEGVLEKIAEENGDH